MKGYKSPPVMVPEVAAVMCQQSAAICGEFFLWPAKSADPLFRASEISGFLELFTKRWIQAINAA